MGPVRDRAGAMALLFAVLACLAAVLVEPATAGSLPAWPPGPAAASSTVPAGTAPATGATSGRMAWERLDTASGELPLPPGPFAQTTLVDGDFDGDGRGEFMIGARGGPNALAWYRLGDAGWQMSVVEPASLPLDAGGTAADVDGDGYLDVVLAGDHTSSSVWWWRNPGPSGWGAAWPRLEIVVTAEPQHHDLGFGDFDGDGRRDLAFWNQGAPGSRIDDVFVATVPADPTVVPWPVTRVYDGSTPGEGLTIGDVDVDGRDDIVLTGGWLRRNDTGWSFEAFDPGFTLGRVVVGQFVPGSRPEIVTSSGDGDAGLTLHRWSGSAWVGTSLLTAELPGPWRHGHSLDVGDVDLDGRLDVFAAEMALGAPGAARAVVLLGDGTGGFSVERFSDGVDNHESRLVDVDADGDLEVVSKPFDDGSPGIAVYRNLLRPRPLDHWARRVVGTRTGPSLFIRHGDLDGDGDADLVTGAQWYENRGSYDPWPAHVVGDPLTDVVAVADFDEDGDLDLFGTRGAGSDGEGHRFAWAANDGSGHFVVSADIEPASPDGRFLQGVAIGRTRPGGPIEVWLSWHEAAAGLNRLVVPAYPSSATWMLDRPSPVSQGEQIAFADVDRDGDPDLLEGHLWLRNDGEDRWVRVDLHAPTACCRDAADPGSVALPDRVVAADVNGDGRLDAVVTHENDPANSVVWFEQPVDPAGLWVRHVMASGGPYPLLSLDVADLDGDGDLDAVVGEHDVADAGHGTGRVLENVDGRGGQWASHVLSRDEEYHDGMQLADLDGDGDLDVFTIGWNHNNVVVHENLGLREAASPWLEPSHRLRVNVLVPAGAPSAETVRVEVGVDVSDALAAVGRTGRFDPGSLRVAEVDEHGAAVASGLARQFVPAADFDPWLFAAGTVRVSLPGPAGVARHLQLYVETADAAIPAGIDVVPTGSVASGSVVSVSTRNGAEAMAGAWSGGPRPAGTDTFVELGGSLSIEAEHFHASDVGSSVHTWSPVASAGAAGGVAMAALPDRGLNASTVPNGTASLHYRARFSAPGIYRLWLRLRAPDANANVVHIGLDGQPLAGSDRISRPAGATFGWTRSTLDGRSAVLVVPAPGEHAIDVWLAEDGLLLDKLFLTRSTTAPVGEGPPESPRDGTSKNRPPVARLQRSTVPGSPLSVRVDGSASSDPDGVLAGAVWDFGDATTATGPTVEHSFARAGTYLVTLTVTDDRGARAVAASEITVPVGSPVPALAAGDVRVVEGPSGSTRRVVVPVLFSVPAPAAGSFVVRTVAGTAAAGTDFVPKAAVRVSFPAGATKRTVTLLVRGDRIDESDESFELVLSDVVGATVADDRATVTVIDDD